MKYLQMFIHFSSILFGGLIYICFRSSDILMFRWFDYLHISDTIFRLRKFIHNYKIEFSDWIIYSLPDGLWMFSYTTVILYIWSNTITRRNYFWIIIMPIVALLTEVGQKYHLINGTFDANDVIAYLLGFVLSCIFFSNCFETLKIKIT